MNYDKNIYYTKLYQSDEDDVLKIIADDIVDIRNVRDKFSKHIHVKISYDQNDPKILNSIKSLAETHKGRCRFILNVEASNGYIQKLVSQDLNVSSKSHFVQGLRDIVGDDNVWIGS